MELWTLIWVEMEMKIYFNFKSWMFDVIEALEINKRLSFVIRHKDK
jgi:hypothetical protein